MTYKLDIFPTLAAIDRHDLEYYRRLTDEQRKGFHPPVVLRWASAVEDYQLSEAYILLVNERANVNFWDIYEHPDLQYRLIASCGLGQQKHKWINMAKTSDKRGRLGDFLAEFWPDANANEISLLVSQFTHESFTEFVEQSGVDSDTAKEVIRAYEKATGQKGGKRRARS